MKISLPFVGMVMAILAQVSDLVVTKAAMSKGVSKYILVVYSSALSSLILLSVALIIHRSNSSPLSFSIISNFFFLALIGYSGVIMVYAGIEYSSPTLCTAMLNLVPAFTFILALIFRMERLDLKTTTGIAKLVGTVVSITGAFIVTFYKGLPIVIIPSFRGFSHQVFLSQKENWILGGFLSCANAFMTSLWYIYQARILNKYPSVLFSCVFFYYLFLSFLSAIVSVIAEKDPTAWMLRPSTGLVAVVYSAIIGNIFRTVMITLCLRVTGPLYVSMFKPLAIVAAALMGVIFLGDALYIGSLVGAIVIVVGFYAVMWGKSQEGKSGEKVPLLQDTAQESSNE